MTESPVLSAMQEDSETPEAAPAQSDRPRHRWALGLLLVATAALYLWDLSGSGWANSFYSAAAQAGSQSWKAFLFGSSDAANSITIDKPPLSIWPSALCIRIFGLNPWSILVPQALMGVASVALLWDAVRRRFGETAGLVSGFVLACTPVAVTIFRFNNPDALLTLLTLIAVWAVLRAVDDGRTRWLVASGVCVGLGFLTKQLQILLIVPTLVITYLVAGPQGLRHRMTQLAAAAAAALASAGWWVLLVQLWPHGRRPWIGGTQHNSILELTFGYNGFGRLSGYEPGATAALGRSSRFGAGTEMPLTWGPTGPARMFDPALIGEIGWLLPAALLFLIVLLIWCGRAPRTDGARAQLLAWGSWLIVMVAVFSYMAGIFHPYYTVALAPAVAALIGIGIVTCWRYRHQLWGRSTLAVAAVVTAATGYEALGLYPDYQPWLRAALPYWAVVVCGALLVARLRRGALQAVIIVPLIAVVVAGPVAYSITTVAHGNSGAIPTSGPWQVMSAQTVSAGSAPVPRAKITEASGPNFLRPRGAPGRPAHIPGCSLLAAGTPSPEVVARLDADAGSYRWAAATVGSMCAAGYQLASGHPVMPVGGFNGTDPAPSPHEFLRWALSKKIHWFIVSNPVIEDRWGHLNEAALIQQWVQLNFTPVMVDQVLMYDLST